MALDGVDFECRAGEIHALLGENGAGKSTLLKVLNGEIRADAGTIEIDGREEVIHSPHAAPSLGISMVHQELALLGNLSVGENLVLGDEPTRVPGVLDRHAMRVEAEELLDQLELQLSPSERLGQLEISDRQAVELCKALAIKARILILDEPTAALGEQECRRLFAILRRLRSQGLAIIYVSHRLREVLDLSDRITVLRNGRRELTESTANLDEQAVIASMVGRKVGDLFPPGASRPPTGKPVVRLSGVGFGERVRGVNAEIRRGEVVGLTGLQGAGQREVARLAAGFLSPTEGTVELGADGTKPRVALVPADRKEDGLSLDRPVRENLTASVLGEIRSRIRLLSKTLEERRAGGIAEEASLHSPLDLETRWLSGGNQQKALLGRAIAERPDLLVLEEPTRGVDVGARSDIYSVIRWVAEQGTAVLVVSTDILEVSGLSDRVLVLRQGEVAAELVAEQASEEGIHEHAQVQAPVTTVERPDGADSEEKKAGIRGLAGWLATREATVPFGVLAAIMIVGALGSGVFLTGDNFSNLSQQAILFALVGAGQLLVILTRGIDLSVGASVGFTNLITTDLLMHSGASLPVAVLVGIAVGALIGMINATLVDAGMPAFLATFAMMSILRGIIVWRYPESIGPVPKSVSRLDDGTLFGIPTLFLITLAVLVVLGLVLRRTTAGLHVYAVGGDEAAARLQGLNVRRVRLFAYGLAGALFGLAGVYLTVHVGAGLPNSGVGLEYDSIAIVLIGGASLAGGRGTVVATAAGVGIVTVLANVMNLWHVDAFYQSVVKGVLILLVGAIWVAVTRRREHRRLLAIGLQG
jgi:ABC-type sugar transport system ATPase subunit/ribose/xylose/arabinose/galactoside ABC-type transport system permease subunit